MDTLKDRTRKFRNHLKNLSREQLLDLIQTQSPKLYAQVQRIEWVFENKMSHLAWDDGTPITSRPLTNEELALLIDEPFEPYPEMTEVGISIAQQRQIHIAKDPILWGKEFLGIDPRVYQILLVRHPSLFKVLRLGRRAGKTFSMALVALHYAYTTNHGRVLVLTPMKPQGGLIYQEMMRFIEASDVVSQSVVRNVTSPQYEIELTNGSTIRFFSTGMKSGGRSDVTRGQEAHIIILDEMDYMGDEDLEAIFAMMQKTSENQPDKQMIGASTPSGKRGVFWRWCTDRTGDNVFREFWFPSYVNPHWDIKMEKFFRNEYTEMGYRHEVEADWGDNVDGVYPRRLVDLSFDYEYAYSPRPSGDPDVFYVMGVDWDKYGAGTNMVVLEVYPEDYPDKRMAGRAKVFYRVETAREEYTLIMAVERIIKMDEVFHFKHIYVDRGFGEVQVELLHKYGVEHPMSGLQEKVKGIQFSETIEVRDPFDQQMVKKEMKPFMVDNLRQFFEKQTLLMPRHDEPLYEQLISYVVARQTSTGRPVFEAPARIGDHAHDALILACLAITQNYGELMRIRVETEAVAVSNHLVLQTFETVNQSEEEYLEDKYGKISAAPVMMRRSGTQRRRTNKDFSRKSF